MDFLSFNDVSWTYPAVEGDLDSNGNQIIPQPVFDHMTASLPGGFVSLVGPNGSGKSTFMLLAAGRLIPQNGKCTLFGQEIALMDENSKNLVASFIYQNMEFDDDRKVKELLGHVYQNGALSGKANAIYGNGDLFDEVLEVFELAESLEKKLNGISKGEIQRILLAFSILYGSSSIFMDEPLFALEESQKEKVLSYLKAFCSKTKTTVYISMHELDLSRKYAENVLLFYPNRDLDFGTPEEVLTDQALEKAYGVPVSMLKHKESMTREELANMSRMIETGK